jgi:hypothetical protein
MRRRLACRRAARAAATAVGALLMTLPTLVWPSPAEAQMATPPPYPESGLGSKGPCGAPTDAELDIEDLDGTDPGAPSVQVSAFNQKLGLDERHVWVYEPTGTGVPRTGGTCNDSQRPVVLLAHGFPATELIWFGPAQPWLYGSLIQNLVSNGYIVVFPNYDAYGGFGGTASETVWYGFDQAVRGFEAGNPWDLEPRSPMTTRADLRRVGVFGHSLGGGLTPRLAQGIAAETISDGNPTTPDPYWGDEALWVVLNAASDLMYHCRVDDDDGDGQAFNGQPEPGGATEDDEDDPEPFPSVRPTSEQCNPTDHPVNMPPNADVLFVSYDGEELGNAVWIPTELLYRDMTPVDRKWAVLVRSDCSHSGEGEHRGEYPCGSPEFDNPAWPTHFTGHLTPVDPVAQVPAYARGRDHLKWYSTSRNVQALAECAIPGDQSPVGDDCDSNLLVPMGTWSDGEPATPAVNLTP